MDALAEVREQIRFADAGAGPETRDQNALLAIAWGLVAVCERMDRWLEMQELEADRAGILAEPSARLSER